MGLKCIKNIITNSGTEIIGCKNREGHSIKFRDMCEIFISVNIMMGQMIYIVCMFFKLVLLFMTDGDNVYSWFLECMCSFLA